MQNQSINTFSEISIKDYAFEKIKKLIYYSIFLCFSATFLYSFYSSIIDKKTQTDQLADLIGKTSGKAILIGGDYLPKSWAKGLVQTSKVSSVWLKSDTNIIAQAHKSESKLALKSIENKSYIINGTELSIVTNKSVFYNGQKIADLLVVSPIELTSIIYISFVSSSIASFLLCFLFFFIRKHINNISVPLTDFNSYIEESIKNNSFSENSTEKKWKYSEINLIHQAIVKYFLKAKESEKYTFQAVSSAQLSKVFHSAKHDITASLGLGESQLARISGNENITASIKSVFNRIYDIIQNIPKTSLLTIDEINELLEYKPDSSSKKNPFVASNPRTILLLSHIKSIVNDEVIYSKDSQQKDAKFDFEYNQDIQKCYVNVDSTLFQRVLINIYKNSLEAIQKNGKITTKLTIENQNICIEIIDNGKGITDTDLQQIGQHGFTKGKDKGSGLGLFTAIEAIKKWGGNLEISSKIRIGTTIKISLPLAEHDYIYPYDLVLNKGTTLVSLDDDPSIHSILREKLKSLHHKDKISDSFFFSSIRDFEAKLETLKKSDIDFVVLMDQNIRGEEEKGLDLILKHELEGNALILSSNAHFESLYNACKQHEVPILSKVLLPELTIQFL